MSDTVPERPNAGTDLDTAVLQPRPHPLGSRR